MGEKNGVKTLFGRKKGARPFLQEKRRVISLLNWKILIFLKSQLLGQEIIILEKIDFLVFAGIFDYSIFLRVCLDFRFFSILPIFLRYFYFSSIFSIFD